MGLQRAPAEQYVMDVTDEHSDTYPGALPLGNRSGWADEGRLGNFGPLTRKVTPAIEPEAPGCHETCHRP
jgi:hypothetical protein